MRKSHLIPFNLCVAACLAFCLCLAPVQPLLAGEAASSGGTAWAVEAASPSGTAWAVEAASSGGTAWAVEAASPCGLAGGVEASFSGGIVSPVGNASPGTAASAAMTAAPDRGVTINVYNWGEYIANGTDGSPDLNEEFTRRTGIQVNYTTFDSNEALYSKLVGGGADYDVIIPSDYMVSKLIDENMLAQLDFSNIPNFRYIDERFRDPDYDPGSRYSVPYTWGVVGLFYNTDYIEEEITSWSALWDDRYAGKILMFDNPRDSFAIAQLVLGQSLNTTEESDWAEAAALLKQQKPLVQAYVMDRIFDKMESSEAWIAPYYSGDAAILVENSDSIRFVVPEEGTNYFVDAMCIPATSSHKAEAEAYINFLCDPEIAGANMNYVGYSTPESAAKEYMDEEMVENPVYYPDEEILARTEVFVNLPESTSKLVDHLWAEVKMGGPGESMVLVAIILGFLAVYIAILVYKRQKRKRELA